MIVGDLFINTEIVNAITKIGKMTNFPSLFCSHFICLCCAFICTEIGENVYKKVK